jgi:hypothetical protein
MPLQFRRDVPKVAKRAAEGWPLALALPDDVFQVMPRERFAVTCQFHPYLLAASVYLQPHGFDGDVNARIVEGGFSGLRFGRQYNGSVLCKPTVERIQTIVAQ